MSKLDANKTSQLVSGPVREIGVQSRSITGTLPNGNRYESALERDFMLLLQFDPAVDIYTPQPLTMRYQASNGDLRRFTPDGLVEWRKDHLVYDPRPILVEIKYREAFAGQWRAWRERISAATKFAAERGWLFQVYTEKEIRTPFLENVKFLLPYLDRPASPEFEQTLLSALSEVVETSPRELLESLSQNKWEQAVFVPVLWRLLAERNIGCNLIQRLTMQSPIWTLR